MNMNNTFLASIIYDLKVNPESYKHTYALKAFENYRDFIKNEILIDDDKKESLLYDFVLITDADIVYFDELLTQ
ncbi:TPA: hypothetical protein ACQVKY_005603 [Serratia marcescens]|nr:hypothetical protein [Serratia marcescens]HAU4297465.1 hypothetical protein [Serratia marcescens]